MMTTEYQASFPVPSLISRSNRSIRIVLARIRSPILILRILIKLIRNQGIGQRRRKASMKSLMYS